MRVLVTCEAAHKAPPYLEALSAAGFADEELKLLLPGEAGDWRRLAAEADGLLLCGGPDVEPWRYGEEPQAEAGLDLLPALDALELSALAGAREAARPALCICRGLQVANVFLGGTLYQDLALQRPGPVPHQVIARHDALAHEVDSARGGHPLAEALGGEPLPVNSRHHQAIQLLGEGLEVIATAPDGVIEAVALRREADESSAWWLEAVQWHPENLLAHDRHRALFERFAAAVRR
jgi:putative glutamine amidotransferase